MQRAIRPRWLLRLADELCYRNGGAGQPRNTNLRQSVSAAYYAVFHSLTTAAARHLYPQGTETELYGVIRSFDHRGVSEVCAWIDAGSGKTHTRALVTTAKESPDVVDIADWFKELQEARHRADYDHEADFSKASVQSLVDLAYDAVEKIEQLTQQGSRELVAFLSLVILRSSIR